MQNPDAKQKPYSRAKAYLTSSVVLLFVFAFFWSVDGAIAYILFGFFLFFLALGLLNWPWRKQNGSRYSGNTGGISQAHASQQASTSPAQQSFDSLFEDILGKARKEVQHTQQKQRTQRKHQPPSVQSRKPIVIAVAFIFFVFLIITLSVVFDDGETTAESLPSDYLQQAIYYYNDNRFDSAYTNYQRALKENPQDTEALFGLGNTFSALDKPDSAILLYNRALAINPSLAGVAYNKGWVEYKRKNYSGAAQVLKDVVNKNPDYLDAMQLLGDIYYEQKIMDEALRWYASAYEKGQRNHWICYVMGYLYQTKGDSPRAIDLYKESLSYDSTELDIYQRLGELMPGEEGEYYRSVAQKKNEW